LPLNIKAVAAQGCVGVVHLNFGTCRIDIIVTGIARYQNALPRFHFIAKRFFDSLERAFIVALP